MSEAQTGAFASFEEKWLAANPEQATVALFQSSDLRLRAAAFGCLIHELEQAAFGLREAHIAEVKIQWWRQELAAAASGAPRHPVSAVLFADPQAAKVGAAHWNELADGALAMLHVGAASDLRSLLSSLSALYTPVAQIEAALFDAPAVQVSAAATLWAISHLLLALRHLGDVPERLPVPLDLLARHELTRAALAEPSPKRSELVRDFLGSLAHASGAALADVPSALVARRVRGRLDLDLMKLAQRADEPLRELMKQPGDARWKALWWSWREARAAATRG
jgi:phytoene synthase